jgi:flagellin
MVVQHNLTAMNSNRQLGITQATQAKSTEKLSSGYRINRAADDAAGLSISEKMRKQIRGLSQASSNAQDGISAVQTAEGALTEVHDMLQRMNELAVKASNGTMSTDDRNYIQSEIDQLVNEIDRVATTTKFNETYLLRGENKASTTYQAVSITVGSGTLATTSTKGTATVSFSKTAGQSITVGNTKFELVKDTTTIGGDSKLGSTHFKVSDMDAFMSAVNLAIKNDDNQTNGEYVKSLTFNGTQLTLEAFAKDPSKALSFSLQVGADSYASNQIDIDINAMSATGLGINGLAISRGASDTTTDETLKAREAIEKITSAIQRVSSQRSTLGAAQNRLEHTINNLDNVVENTTAAESAIRDTDMASEMVKYSNNQILAQAGQSMLAQANQANQGVLSLLG